MFELASHLKEWLTIILLFWNTAISIRLWAKRKVNADKAQLEAMKKADKALLHDRLFTLCEMHLRKGVITRQEMENLEYIYTAYKAYTMNGTGEKLFNRCMDLRLMCEEREEEEI